MKLLLAIAVGRAAVPDEHPSTTDDKAEEETHCVRARWCQSPEEIQQQMVTLICYCITANLLHVEQLEATRVRGAAIVRGNSPPYQILIVLSCEWEMI